MPTIIDIFKTEYKKLLDYYKEKNMALSVFKFLYAYTFQKPFFFADNKTIFSNEKKIEFKKYVDQITLFDIPYQYILKHVPFIDADIEVSPPILIPRNETEWWTDWLIKKLQKKKNERLFIADICSGSGCIGISLLQSFQNSFCDAFDISHQAITLSSKNAKQNKVKSRYKIYLKDIFKLKKHEKYDIIVANPPYISLEAYQELDPSVKKWESKTALTDGKEGHTLITYIIKFFKKNLKINSVLCIEICDGYHTYIKKYATKIYPKDFVFLLEDQYNKKRVIVIAKGEYKKIFENIYETR